MELAQLRAFLETADAGALSRAARVLGVAQPSLTQQIQRLERHLGTALFHRHARGVVLTEAGEALYPRARRLLDELRAAESAVRRGRRSRAPLTVGAIPTVAPYVLPEALKRLRARDATRQVAIREEVSAALARQLQAGELDVVIAAQPYPFDHLDVEVLGEDALVVAVPATHAAARAGVITLDELRDAPAVTLDPAHCLGEQVADFCSSRHVHPAVACRTVQLATVLELVGVGVGVSIVPALAAARQPLPTVAFVPLADQPLRRQIVAAWRPTARRTVAARAFVDCVREALRGW
jgi:LysR family hydrogen peroxide-inducible transcriptional activator